VYYIWIEILLYFIGAKMIKPIFSILFTLFCGVVIGGTIHPEAKDEQHRKYAEGFPFVGQLFGLTYDGFEYHGSCVAYNDFVIITAAHVLNEGVITHMIINNKKLKIKEKVIHEDFKTKEFGPNDIALCLIEEKIGLSWYPDLYSGRDELNKICSISGFGLTGDFVKGAHILDGKKRAGSNKISSINNGLLICDPSRFNKTSLEFFIAPGDSGGGLFIKNDLAGINSCISAIGRHSKSDYGSESGHTRISDHVDWIKKNTKRLMERSTK
jgi:hypothetical protein